MRDLMRFTLGNLMQNSKKYEENIFLPSLNQPDVFFRFMQEEDLNKVLIIERASFISPWSKFYFLHELHFNANSLLIMMIQKNTYEETVIGYADLWKEKNWMHIANFAISPDARNRGYGTALLHFICYYAEAMDFKKIRLEVRISNFAAIRLYKKIGFSTLHTIPEYYVDNKEDGYCMEADVRKCIELLMQVVHESNG